MPTKTVVVMRTGSPFFIRGRGASAIGEDDTQCVVERLAKDYRVIYFGHARGEAEGFELFKPDIDGLDENSRASEIAERCDPWIEKMKDAIAVVNIGGAPPSWSWPDNPNVAFTQAFAVRYCAPALYTMHKLDRPRVMIITDPKVYPRDCEMATIWPNIRPVAVLTQEDITFRKRMQDVAYMVHGVYAGCEYWRTEGWEPRVYAKEFTVTTAAHSHYGNDQLGTRRDEIWPMILDKYLETNRNTTRICGKNWEKTPLGQKYDEVFVGVLSTQESVHAHLGSGECGPLIPQKIRFNTTKIRMHALHGNVPLPYGRGGPYTYDADERVVPLVSSFRIDESEDGLAKAVAYVRDRPAAAAEYVQDIIDRTKPDWSKLIGCLEEIEQAGTPEFIERYGGYIKC